MKYKKRWTKVLFTDHCRWQNFRPSLLRLVDRLYIVIHKTQKTSTLAFNTSRQNLLLGKMFLLSMLIKKFWVCIQVLSNDINMIISSFKSNCKAWITHFCSNFTHQTWSYKIKTLLKIFLSSLFEQPIDRDICIHTYV